MSHYAKLGSLDSDNNREVLEVHVIDDEWDEGEKTEVDGIAMLVDTFGGTADNWKKTSRNTDSGIHVDPDTGEPDGGTAFRKNYAGMGMLYDADRDAFYNPSPFPSWTLQEDTCKWESPDGPRPKGSSDPEGPEQSDKRFWNEGTLKWDTHGNFLEAIKNGTTAFPDNDG